MTIPNQITLLRLALIPFFSYFVMWPDPRSVAIAVVLFLIASGTDWLDGYLARRLNQVTDLGKLLDPLADKILVTAALVSLTQMRLVPAWTVTLILAREFLITGMRSLLIQQAAVLSASVLAKWKTFIQMVAVTILLLVPLTGSTLQMLGLAFYYVALGLAVVSAADYIWKSMPLLRVSQQPSVSR